MYNNPEIWSYQITVELRVHKNSRHQILDTNPDVFKQYLNQKAKVICLKPVVTFTGNLEYLNNNTWILQRQGLPWMGDIYE